MPNYSRKDVLIFLSDFQKGKGNIYHVSLLITFQKMARINLLLCFVAVRLKCLSLQVLHSREHSPQLPVRKSVLEVL